MKNLRFILALAVAAFAAAFIQAEDKKDEHPAKPAGCCARAEAKGEKCTHECCVESATHGDNCEKCKGHGKIEPKK